MKREGKCKVITLNRGRMVGLGRNGITGLDPEPGSLCSPRQPWLLQIPVWFPPLLSAEPTVFLQDTAWGSLLEMTPLCPPLSGLYYLDILCAYVHFSKMGISIHFSKMCQMVNVV